MDKCIKRIISEMPNDYDILRVVTAALYALQDQLADPKTEEKIIKEYGTELNDCIDALSM